MLLGQYLYHRGSSEGILRVAVLYIYGPIQQFGWKSINSNILGCQVNYDSQTSNLISVVELLNTNNMTHNSCNIM